MKEISLHELSRAELAGLLASCDRHSVQWHRIRAECERREKRWSTVMHYAWFGILACMFVVALAT